MPNSSTIQVGVARHLARDIPRRLGHILATISILAPVVEWIPWRHRAAIVRRPRAIGRCGDTNLLAGMNRERFSAGGRLTFASAYGHDGGIALLVDVDAVLARTKQRECR